MGLGFVWLDGADVVCVGDSASIGYLGFLMNFIVPVPFIFSFSGLDFPTSFGRSLPHSFALYFSQISLSGPFRSLSRDGCLPDSGGMTSAAM